MQVKDDGIKPIEMGKESGVNTYSFENLIGFSLSLIVLFN